MAMTFDPFAELARNASNSTRAMTRPMPVDLYRDQDRYVLSADLPGVDPGSIDIDVDGQLLTIRAHRTSSSTHGVKWLSQERPAGSYLRQFNIGKGVDADRISASYENGVLSVIIPLSEKARPRKVTVETPSASPELQNSLAS